MKQFIKLSAAVLAVLLFVQTISIAGGRDAIAHAAEADSPKLLSGNAQGSLFTEPGQSIATGAAYVWQREGLFATDPGLISGDAGVGPSMTDGNVSAVISSEAQTGEAYGTLVYDLQDVYRVSSVQTWAEYSATSGVKQIEIYASMDGTNYNRVAVTEPTLADTAGIAPVVSDMKPSPYARYVKMIVHKDPAKLKLSIGEVAVWGEPAEPQSLLSNNQLKAGGYYPVGTPKVDTKATYKWNTDQPFVTQAGMIASDNEAGAKDDGSAAGLPDLTDGSSLEETASTTASMDAGSKGQYASVTFTLNDMYQIGKIDVWSKAGGGSFMDGYEVLLSTDNVNYFSAGYTANPNSHYVNGMVNSPSYGIPGKHAKYVRIVMHNANDSDRLIAGEVAIWGWKLYDATLAKKDTPDQVEFSTYVKNYNTLYLDWSAYNAVVNKVNKYSIYIQKSDFTDTSGKTPYVTADNGTLEQKGKFTLISSLEPETTYYIAITPTSTASGERKDVKTLKVKTPSVLGGEKIGDIFAINDTPYGGGNYVNHGAKEDENIIRKLILMRNIEGINMNRWWVHDSWVKSFSNKYGIGFHEFYHGPQDVPLENKQGTWTFSTVNEPDLKGTNPATLALTIKSNHESLKGIDSRNLLVEPALGGTEPASMTWLENFYKSDGQTGAQVKNYFDVLDVHPYVKNHEGSLPGLIPGAPEMLIGKIKEIQALKAKYGDQDKPVIFTELGWSTYTGSGYLRQVDRVTQRNYLARAYMHAIAGGIKRMHWYDFQDDGTDPANLEHNLGMIDWYGVPKPSYYAYYTMAKVLKDARYVGVKANVDHPYYGYEYWDEGKNQYITSLWAADESTKTATFQTQDTGLTVVGIDGSYAYLPVSGGTASLTISGAPVFIYSKSSLDVSSIDDSFVLTNSAVDVRRGDILQTDIKRSGMGAEMSGRLELIGPSADWKLDGEVNFAPGTAAIPISIPIPLNAEEKAQELTLQVISGTSLIASMKLTANVLETIKVRVVPEVVEPGQWNQWHAALYVENATPDKELSGSISVAEAVYVALGESGPIAFEGLRPGEVKKLTIPITGLPEQARARLKLAVELDSGFTKLVERPFNFLAAVNDQTAPVIDGKLSEPSWHTGMPIVINRLDQNKNIANWGGEPDLSGKGFLKWDRSYLYFGMEVQDDIHVQQGTGGDMWQGDSVQFAIDTGRADGAGSAENNEFGIALGAQGPIVWRWLAANGKAVGEMTSVQAAVYRSETATTYELALPWSEILPEGSAPSEGDVLGFSMLMNENDGTTRRGWLEYMSGIGSSKNTQLYEDLILAQVGAPEVSVTGVALDHRAATLDIGQPFVLKATVSPGEATNKKVSFTSSNPSVVSVTQEVYGLTATVTGVSAGTATITVATEDGGFTASSTVTVKPPVEDDVPSGGTGGGGGGSAPEPKPEPPVIRNGTIVMPMQEANPDGVVSVEVAMDILEKAIQSADSASRGILAIEIPGGPGAVKTQIKLPVAVLKAAQAANIERVEIRSDLATIALTPEALAGYVKPDSANVEISVAMVSSSELAGAAAERTGTSAIYDFSVMLDGVKIERFFGRDAVRVSMDYTLTAGENADQVIVYHIPEGRTLEVVKNGRYDAAQGKVTFTTDHFSLYSVLYTPITFGDLEDAAWARSSIEALAAREIVNGVGGERFAPNDRVTRAQFIQMLMSAFDLTDLNAAASFSDVRNGDWFYQAVASAQKLGIVQGYEDGSFGIDREISRQDMAVMTYRAMAAAQISLRQSAKPESFTDGASIGAYAREAVEAMQQAGIINGLEENRFAPESFATRAQAAKIIYSLLSM
ncbi:S-layer homology domain-containing protein [Paenibacillus oryzisoli]|uniref:S-layer homology domain-containing protein n=1 Tax=Paenibacillus oryzisoli TaxID=1850517 RepID=UPI003D2DFB1A